MALTLKRIFRGFSAGEDVTGTIHMFNLKSTDLERWGIIRKTPDETPNSKRKKLYGRENDMPEKWYFTGNTVPQHDHDALHEFEDEDRRYDD